MNEWYGGGTIASPLLTRKGLRAAGAQIATLSPKAKDNTMKSIINYGTGSAYDILTDLTESVIENHLKVTYADEADYLDALIAAAWDRIETHLSTTFAAHTLTMEVAGVCNVFKVPVFADRIGTDAEDITINYWDGTAYAQATTYSRNNIGCPFYIEVDSEDEALKNATTEGTLAASTLVVEMAAKEVPAAVKQAFLLYLGFLYEKREAVVTGAVATELPKAYEYLLAGTRKSIWN